MLLGGGYALVVLGLGQLLGQGSRLVVAGATLAVTLIAAFSGRLRQHVDLDTLTAELPAVVDQAMQPTKASPWLRPSVTTLRDLRGTDATGPTTRPTTDSSPAPQGLGKVRA